MTYFPEWIFNMVIPILMHFLTFIRDKHSISSATYNH